MNATVVFSDQELALIKKHRLWEFPLVHMDSSATPGVAMGVDVKGAHKGAAIFWSPELGEIKNCERELKAQLVELKEIFEGAASHSPSKSESFEL
jgi:hypothetical protein